MSNDLFRLVHPVSEQGLVEALRDPHLLEVASVDAEVDLSDFDAALEQLVVLVDPTQVLLLSLVSIVMLPRIFPLYHLTTKAKKLQSMTN